MFVRTEDFLDLDTLRLGFLELLSSKMPEPLSTLDMDLISEISILSTTKSESFLAKKIQSFVKIICLSRQITLACTVRRSTVPLWIHVSFNGSGVNNDARCADFGDLDCDIMSKTDALKLA